MKINKKYKDSVFIKLFSNKKEIINLYNAIKDTNYDIEKTEIEIITLEKVLFMERNNDLCFTIDNKLVVLIEHQSTINNNMPLRFLLYIAREYEKILDENNIYKEKLVKIPTPEFIVLYNGERNYEERKLLKLSDAFYNNENVKLELIVDIININYNKNINIINKSKTLNEYSYFIYLVRENIKNNKDKVKKEDLIKYSIEKTIKECIEKNILKEFLKMNSSEVLNMLYTELKIEKAEKIWKEEAFQDGIEVGISKGRELGREEGRELGREEGIEIGMVNQIKALKKYVDKEELINIVKEDYNVSREEIEKYL